MRSRIAKLAPLGVLFGILFLGIATAQDGAARLFDEGRKALNQDHYREAVSKFEEVWEEYEDSDYAGDALYWYAFALYRLGATDDLHRAQYALQRAQQLYMEAMPRADAAELAMRIRGKLAERGDAEAAQQLLELAQVLDETGHSHPAPAPKVSPTPDTPDTPDPDEELKIAALNALLHMDSDHAVPILKSVLKKRTSESAKLRENAVFLLSQKRTKETAEILLDVARNDPDPDVRGNAVFWLGEAGGDEAVDLLEELLTSSEDPEIQEKAVFALSQRRSERAARILRDLAANPGASLEAREGAIFWLGQRKSKENYDFLRELYEDLEQRSLKEKVIFSISQLEGKKAGDWLFDIALNESEDMELRKNALFWAGQKTRIPVERLDELYSSLEHQEMKEQVIFVLSQRKGKESVDKLLEIARSEEDVELRKQAIFWLSQTKDPRVVDLLEELIGE
jgi:HEAT repeat protein